MFKFNLTWSWTHIIFILLFNKNIINVQTQLTTGLGQLMSGDLARLLTNGNVLGALQNNIFFDGAEFTSDLSEGNSDNFDLGDTDNIFTPGYYMNITELIKKRGYRYEQYKVITEDGYILSLTRIMQENPGPYLPVYLQHGVLAASDQWLLLGRNKNLGFMLADSGFDVWLGDQRGNFYSRKHVQYSSNNPKFWDFSFQESAMYDLPAFISKILEVTKAPKVSYVGHSMGTTVFLAMASQRPEIANLVQLSVLLAPVCYPPKPSQSGPVNMLVRNSERLVRSLRSMRINEFLPRRTSLQTLVQRVCSPEMFVDFCIALVGTIYGENKKNLDKSMVPLYFSSVPSGTSLKTFLHLLQIFKSGKFGQFNYGTEGNLARYNSSVPPEYPVHTIQTPVALIFGNNDGFLDRKTVHRLKNTLPNVVLLYEVLDPNFSHLDFVFGKDAKSLVYNKIVKLLKMYNKVPNSTQEITTQ